MIPNCFDDSLLIFLGMHCIYIYICHWIVLSFSSKDFLLHGSRSGETTRLHKGAMSSRSLVFCPFRKATSAGDTIWLFNISHGKSLINGGFNGTIIYKWAIFHGYVK
jgi:hypothetical protein